MVVANDAVASRGSTARAHGVSVESLRSLFGVLPPVEEARGRNGGDDGGSTAATTATTSEGAKRRRRRACRRARGSRHRRRTRRASCLSLRGRERYSARALVREVVSPLALTKLTCCYSHDRGGCRHGGGAASTVVRRSRQEVFEPSTDDDDDDEFDVVDTDAGEDERDERDDDDNDGKPLEKRPPGRGWRPHDDDVR